MCAIHDFDFILADSGMSGFHMARNTLLKLELFATFEAREHFLKMF
jgi:hypothetical protein